MKTLAGGEVGVGLGGDHISSLLPASRQAVMRLEAEGPAWESGRDGVRGVVVNQWCDSRTGGSG